jgi:toxin ParE1/3/4
VTQATGVWPIRIAAAAETDIQDIVSWTVAQFGAKQARIYLETLTTAIAMLAGGPKALGVQVRDDIAPGLFTLHVTRLGRKGRHFVIFRVSHDRKHRVIDVLRILHDSMDLPRHLPPPEHEA